MEWFIPGTVLKADGAANVEQQFSAMFLGGGIVIFLYGAFLYRILNIARNAKDYYGGLIAIGIFAMFLFQIFENIGMTMGVMPVTGITLPFISYGGSSILTNMMALGLVLNVGMRSKLINF